VPATRLRLDRAIRHFRSTANSKYPEKYPDSRKKSFTRQNCPDSNVFGFKVPTLDSGFKISGDTTKPGSFIIRIRPLVYKRQNQSDTQTFRIGDESGTFSSSVNLV